MSNDTLFLLIGTGGVIVEKLVVKSNALIMAKFRLTLNEQRLILFILAEKITKFDKEFGVYKVSRTELEVAFGRGMAYFDEIVDTINKLNSRKLSFYDGNDWVLASWVSAARINRSKKEIIIEFPQILKPYLLDIKDNFTKYGLDNIIYLKSSHSIRLYEILKQRVKLKIFQFTVEDLKEYLGILPEEYSLFGHFKDKVLNVAQEQINKNTDIRFLFSPIKTGRKFTAIKFEVIESSISRQKQLPSLETPPFESQELFDRLISFGASPSEAEIYFKKYSIEKIQRNLLLCEEKEKEGVINSSKRGYLRKSLELDFAYINPEEIEKSNNKNEISEKIKLWRSRDSLNISDKELEEIEEYITVFYRDVAKRQDWAVWRTFLG